LLLLALFVAMVGPWIAMAIAGVLTSDTKGALLLAAPSPAFAFAVAEELQRSTANANRALWAGAGAALLWTATGLLLLILGSRRARMVAARSRAMRAHLEGQPQGSRPPPEAVGHG
jgi:hypothetical protein